MKSPDEAKRKHSHDVNGEEEGLPPDGTVSNIERKANKRKSRRASERKYQDDLSDDEAPEHDPVERLTSNGGYAHTLKSKLRISKANKGNVPWNKGGNRSAADRAKISAGVRARNRAILLEKLEKIGMTEDEWLQKKKEIKYLRERVRRAKKANDEKTVLEQQKLLQSALDATEINGSNAKTAAKVVKEEAPPKPKVPPKAKINQNLKDMKVPETNTKKKKRRRSCTESTQHIDEIFSRDVEWTPHAFDADHRERPYNGKCPKGGPGGLICCSSCTKNYSNFLTQTGNDMETQKTHKTNKEIRELLGILSDARAEVGDAMRTAGQTMGSGMGGSGFTRREYNRLQRSSSLLPSSSRDFIKAIQPVDRISNETSLDGFASSVPESQPPNLSGTNLPELEMMPHYESNRQPPSDDHIETVAV